jgi:hypothetical protein
MRLVYIDEAGTSMTEPVLTVAAVVVDADRQLVALERYLDKLVGRWIPDHQRQGFIFHATELFNGTHRGSGKPFERDHPDWPIERRLEIADQLAAIPTKFNLPITVGWVERSNFPGSPELQDHWQTRTPGQKAVIMHVLAFAACALKIDLWMRKNTQNEICMLIVEDHEQARSMLRESQKYHQQNNVVDFQKGENKKYSRSRESRKIRYSSQNVRRAFCSLRTFAHMSSRSSSLKTSATGVFTMP